MNEQQINEFIAGYITAMLWSTSDDLNGEDFDDLLDFELAPVTRTVCEKECREFIATNAEDLNAYTAAILCHDCTESGHAGYDFWLTRAGHGVGFWARGLGDLGDRLTKACESAGNREPYLGDNGLVYISGFETVEA